MKTRQLNPTTTPTLPIPKSHLEWRRFMAQVIERAERTGHRHLPGLRAALSENQAENHLRRLGIVSKVDLDREFPLPQ